MSGGKGHALRRPLHVHIPKTAGTSVRHALSIRDPPHLRASELRRELGEETWAAGFSFTIVRNPFDRLLSVYAYGVSHRRRRTRLRYQALSFTDWVRQELAEDGEGSPVARRRYSEWVDEPLDYVGRFEALASSWEHIQRELSVATPIELPVIHRTSHGDYRDAYDQEARRSVERHFAQDLQTYGYCF